MKSSFPDLAGLLAVEPVPGGLHPLGYFRRKGGFVRSERQRFERAVNLADAFGVRVAIHPRTPRYYYQRSSDPNVSADIMAPLDDGDYEPSGVVIHDLAHMQIAAPSRRYAPDFGLGSFSNTIRSARRQVSSQQLFREEALASVLAAVWFEYLGVERFLSSLMRLGRETDSDLLRGHLQWLYRKGLLDAEGRPQLRFRRPADGYPPLTEARIHAHWDAHGTIYGGLWRAGSNLYGLRPLGTTPGSPLQVAVLTHPRRPQGAERIQSLAEIQALSGHPFVPLWPKGGLLPDRYGGDPPTPVRPSHLKGPCPCRRPRSSCPTPTSRHRGSIATGSPGPGTRPCPRSRS